MPPPVEESLIRETEALVGFNLPVLLKRIYLEIGNGCFGPGYGLLGLRGGYVDSDGRTLLEAYDHVKDDVVCHLGGSRRMFLPLCEWGAGVWSCLDCGSGALPILTLDEGGFTRTRFSLQSWLENWAQGQSLWKEMFEFSEIEGVDPFTKTKKTFTRRGIPIGEKVL
jgi:hypothetical protein